MKARKRWQYYCDHCKKSGANKSAMADHERRCFRNPQRVCTVCDCSTPESLAEQVKYICDHYLSDPAGTIKAVEKAFENCPACTLSAIIQADLRDDIDAEDHHGMAVLIERKAFIEYPYKAKVAEYLREKREEEAQYHDVWL